MQIFSYNRRKCIPHFFSNAILLNFLYEMQKISKLTNSSTSLSGVLIIQGTCIDKYAWSVVLDMDTVCYLVCNYLLSFSSSITLFKCIFSNNLSVTRKVYLILIKNDGTSCIFTLIHVFFFFFLYSTIYTAFPNV